MIDGGRGKSDRPIFVMTPLSKSCVYGLRACMLIAARAPGAAFLPTREIASALKLSFPFLAKALQPLTGAGLLRSRRGPGGGVALARPAEQLNLLDLVIALDGHGLFRDCALGLPSCGKCPCPLHDQWAEQRVRLEALFAHTTLKEWATSRISGRIGT